MRTTMEPTRLPKSTRRSGHACSDEVGRRRKLSTIPTVASKYATAAATDQAYMRVTRPISSAGIKCPGTAGGAVGANVSICIACSTGIALSSGPRNSMLKCSYLVNLLNCRSTCWILCCWSSSSTSHIWHTTHVRHSSGHTAWHTPSSTSHLLQDW